MAGQAGPQVSHGQPGKRVVLNLPLDVAGIAQIKAVPVWIAVRIAVPVLKRKTERIRFAWLLGCKLADCSQQNGSS